MNVATSFLKGGFLQYLFVIFTILLLSSISNAALLNEAKKKNIERQGIPEYNGEALRLLWIKRNMIVWDRG